MKPADFHILVVEDSPTQALLLQNMIERCGFSTTIQYNGTSALEFLKDHTPDMIFSDISFGAQHF